MKKSLLFLLLALCLGGAQANAKVVPFETAKLTGYNYLAQKVGSQNLPGIDALTLSYTSTSSTGEVCYYVFNAPVGFVMVSAEDAVQPILAYSNDRNFNGTKIPANVLYFISGYTSQIHDAKINHLEATPETATKWYNILNKVAEHSAAKTTVVTPLLTTSWDQSPYYNDSCPYDAVNAGLSVTGCVATATAQVMKYWNWPATGVGSNTYTSVTMGFTSSANFGGASYNWASMPNSVTTHNPEVAKLMFHVGVAVDMDYSNSSTGSGAYVISSSTGTPPYCAQYALSHFFRYDPAIQGLSRSSYTDAVWIAKITTDLDAGRPVIYSGQGTSGGHCWVLDGYDASNNMHCNWGWSGAGPDGYYAISAMNPPILGTGGGGGGFNASQQAIFNIKPAIMPITGTLTVCAGATTSLSDATPGGTWTSGTPSVATISTSGVVTGVGGGTSVITYSVGGNSVTATVTVNPLPNAGTITGGATTICMGTTLTLSESGSGGSWTSSAPTVATISGGVVTGIASGTTTISYGATNSCGSSYATTTVTVNSTPALTTAPTVTPPGTTPCAGSSATYTATCPGATTFVWTVSGTGWSGSSSSSSISAGVGTGTGTLIVSGSNTCGNSPSYTVTVTPNTIPAVPSVSLASALPCTGATSAIYNATSTGATSFVWSITGTGWSGSSTTSSINLTLGTGGATLICAASNVCGTSNQDTLLITTSPLPTAPVVTLTSPFPCISTPSATYSALSSGAVTYSWSVTGTGWSGSSTASTLNVAIGSGSGTIVCMGVNSCGAGTATTVNLTPSSGVGAASPILATTSMCSGNSATFITSGIAGASSYFWTITGTGWSGTSTSTMITTTVGTGPATISVAGVSSCGTGVPYVLTSVIPTIVPVPSFSLGSHVAAVSANDLLTYTGSSAPTGTYTWDFGGGLASPGFGVGPHLVSWSTAGLKTISLSVTEDGCSSVVYTDTVLVETTTDLENLSINRDCSVYPNPSNGSFKIMFTNNIKNTVEVKLIDVQGRVVYENRFENVNKSVSIEAQNLPNAVYTATIITEGEVINKKVLINR